MTQTHDDHRESTPPTLTRRRTLDVLTASAGVAAALALHAHASAQEDEGTPEAEGSPAALIESTVVGEMPTTGAIRGLPVGTQPQGVIAATATIPANIQIARAQIDAEIETLNIVNGAMENPTGPWIVSWYQQTAELGEVGNVVLAGHVDYWNVGPSVFYNLRNLVADDEIVLTGENGTTYTYAVVSNDVYGVQELVGGKLADVVSPTTSSVVTILTCGGEFDYVNGEYLSRTVVRANLKA